MLKRLREHLASPEGQASMQKWANKMVAEQQAKERRAERVNNLSDEDFEKLMQRIERDNNGDWEDKCYKRGYEPHPTHLLYLLFDTSEMHGQDVTEEWQKDYSFPLAVYSYRGYTFFSMFGQGVHQRVYRGEECIIHL
jgi:hypothetical protein